MPAKPVSVTMVVVLFATASLAGPVARLEAQAPPTGSQPLAASSSSIADGLGVSLKNVRKQLVIPGKPGGGSDLRYNFQVEVIGRQPRIEFFKEFNLTKEGGVSYGAPTHQEILNTVTPMGFRNYGGIDLLSLKKK